MGEVFLLVSTGQGPLETRTGLALFAEPFQRACEDVGVECGWNAEDDQSPRSVLIALSGERAAWLAGKFEGLWVWHARSPFRPNHKRRMWCANAYQVNGPSRRVVLDASKITWKTTRAGGPGGQHQNTTDSAVIGRYVCPDSGRVFVGQSRDGRSQHQNRATALRRLEDALALVQEQANGERDRALHALRATRPSGQVVASLSGPGGTVKEWPV